MSSSPLITDPSRAGIFLDFDGTLSRIVDRPQDARPLPGAREVLGALGERFAVVCVVSGRSAHELSKWLGPGVEIWGLHGAQHAVGGRVRQSRLVDPYLEMMRTVFREAEAALPALGIPGALVEDKQVMVGLHWRAAEDHAKAERALRDLAAHMAREHGLIVAEGKLALELRPPVELSKKGVILHRSRQEDLRCVLFAGDDVVDLPAFDALDELEAGGIAVVRIAVASDEMPQELRERADVVVPGPEGLLAWLQELPAASGGVTGSSPD